MTFENNFFGHMGFPISVLSMWLMLSTVEQLRETCEYNLELDEYGHIQVARYTINCQNNGNKGNNENLISAEYM